MRKIEEPRKVYIVVDSNNNWLATYSIISEKDIHFIRDEFIHEVSCGDYDGTFELGAEFTVFRVTEVLKGQA